jgi:hypothetical protein
MVFRPEAAPKTRAEFMGWYRDQTKWAEGHSYNDPVVTSNELRNWFMEMITIFPAMNGPYATKNRKNELVTDYCIGRDVIYVTFAWSIAEKAYEVMKSVTEKHKIGFFDASANNGDILFPDGNGMNVSIDRAANLSSIQQIKGLALPGQENMSVQDILYSKLNIKKAGGKWWQRIFGSK